MPTLEGFLFFFFFSLVLHPCRISRYYFKSQIRKSFCPFSIPGSLLKSLHSIIAKPLEILYNLSLSSGTVPDSF